MTKKDFQDYIKVRTEKLILENKSQKMIHKVIKALCLEYAPKLGKENNVTKRSINSSLIKLLKDESNG